MPAPQNLIEDARRTVTDPELARNRHLRLAAWLLLMNARGFRVDQIRLNAMAREREAQTS